MIFHLLLFLSLAHGDPVVIPPRNVTIPLEKAPKTSKIERKAPMGPLYLDARSSFAYATGHRLGALLVRWEDFSQTEDPHKGNLDPDSELLARKVASLGVKPDRMVVVYGDGAQGHGEEGRIAWMLRFLGVKDVEVRTFKNEKARMTVDESKDRWSAPLWLPKVLEGIRFRQRDVENVVLKKKADGKAAAQKAGSGLPDMEICGVAPKASTKTSTKTNSLTDIDCDLPPVIIDVRPADEFKGKVTGLASRQGHIPGAVNIPWTSFIGSDGEVVPPTDISGILKSHGVDPDSDLIFYADQGLESGYAAFAVLRTHLHARNYDGGFVEWAGDSKLPVEK